MIDRDEVRRVARLARLALTSEEEERLAPQLSRILEYVELLGELDREGVREATHVAVPAKTLRPDEIRAGLPREEVLRDAPGADAETFRVPPVLPGEGA